MTEEELIEQLINRDENACRTIISQHKEMVFRLCISFINSREDAEEITQDVFISAIKNISSFKKDANLQTWLYRIAINHSLNFTRKQKKVSVMKRLGLSAHVEKEMQKQQHADSDESAETKQIALENNRILYNCVELLKEDQRIAFTLNKVDNFTYAEVAEIMKISLASVESLIHRAKTKLQEKLIRQLR
jgi:RNA polymerase sigma-70 factor, ECF subfamily